MRRLLMAAGGGGSFPAPAPEAGPDYEFGTALSAAWTPLSGSLGVCNANDTVAGCLYMEGSSSQGVWIPLPVAVPFTVTARVSALVNDASAYSDMGIMLGEATPGKFIHGCFDVAYLGSITIMGSYWSSPAVWVGNIGSEPGGVPSPRDVPHYTRFVVNTQDDVDGYYSQDGTTWYQWLNAYNPAFTIGSVGLDIHGDGTSMTVDWIRFT